MSFPVGLARTGPEAGIFTDDLSYRTPTLKQLKPHQEHMARLVACGAEPGELVRLTGFTPSTISRMLSSPLFQAVVARLTGEIEEGAVYNVRQELENLSGRALEIVAEDLDRPATCHVERVQRSRVAFEVLDRAGYSKKEGPVLHLHKHDHHDVKDMDTESLLNNVLEMSRD